MLAPELIVAIPVEFLEAHHPVLAQCKLEGAAATSASSKRRGKLTEASRMPRPLPQPQQYIISFIKLALRQRDVEGPSIQSKQHDELGKTLWSKEEAAAREDTFSKPDCAVYEDGTCIRVQDIMIIEEYTQTVCAFLLMIDPEETEKHKIRNWHFFIKQQALQLASD
ncbi:hypothetical protein V8E36_002147 [Tilletia maclaganii]